MHHYLLTRCVPVHLKTNSNILSYFMACNSCWKARKWSWYNCGVCELSVKLLTVQLTDRQTHRDRQTERQTDRQTDRETILVLTTGRETEHMTQVFIELHQRRVWWKIDSMSQISKDVIIHQGQHYTLAYVTKHRYEQTFFFPNVCKNKNVTEIAYGWMLKIPMRTGIRRFLCLLINLNRVLILATPCSTHNTLAYLLTALAHRAVLTTRSLTY